MIFDSAWRIVVGLSLVPAFGTLYQRLTLPESDRYLKSKAQHVDGELAQVNLKKVEEKTVTAVTSDSSLSQTQTALRQPTHFQGPSLFSKNATEN